MSLQKYTTQATPAFTSRTYLNHLYRINLKLNISHVTAVTFVVKKLVQVSESRSTFRGFVPTLDHELVHVIRTRGWLF